MPLNKEQEDLMQEEFNKLFIADILKEYDQSWPSLKRSWRHLVLATKEVGWKDLCYMLDRLQDLTNDCKYYRIKKLF